MYQTFTGIDLFSDTATRPTLAMKQAMLAAELGDDQRGEDPTTQQLEKKVAALLGHEAAMFFPTSTMANQIALKLLSKPGDELLGAESCHLFFAEAGGPAIHSGLMARPIRSATSVFTGEDVRLTFRAAKGPHYPISRIVSVENTTNMGGGIAWDQASLNSVLDAAQELELKTHLDGSRLFNAVVKTGLSATVLAERFDTVTICLSKGLGCPVGAVLAFSAEHYTEVRRLKQLFGGALRQSGMLAAAGIYALDHHVDRLAEDHANANLLAQLLHAEVPYLQVENIHPSTNMVFFNLQHAKMNPLQFNAWCLEHHFRFSMVGHQRFRAVTHLDIKTDDIHRVVDMLKKLN